MPEDLVSDHSIFHGMTQIDQRHKLRLANSGVPCVPISVDLLEELIFPGIYKHREFDNKRLGDETRVEFTKRSIIGESALGHRLQTGEMENAWYTVVCVVGDSKTSGLAAYSEPTLSTPYEQSRGGGCCEKFGNPPRPEI